MARFLYTLDNLAWIMAGLLEHLTRTLGLKDLETLLEREGAAKSGLLMFDGGSVFAGCCPPNPQGCRCLGAFESSAV